jgi:hypothetical protein
VKARDLILGLPERKTKPLAGIGFALLFTSPENLFWCPPPLREAAGLVRCYCLIVPVFGSIVPGAGAGAGAAAAAAIAVLAGAAAAGVNLD